MKAKNQVPNKNSDFQELFQFLRKFMDFPNIELEKKLTDIMVTRVFNSPEIIQAENKIADKAFYIVSGMVYAFYYNPDQEIVPFRLFRKGRIALIPESFMTGNPATYGLMSCAKTRLLEVSVDQMGSIYQDFPVASMMALKIVATLSEKDRVRNQMLDLGHERSILKFYELYPDLLEDKSFRFYDKHIAHYLHMSWQSFSRLKSKLFTFL